MEEFDPHLEMEGFDRLLRFARRLRPRRPVWPASDRSLPGSSPDFRTDARALTGSHPSHIQDSKKEWKKSTLFYYGGDGGIRTLAPVTRPVAFRVRSLEPLEYISIFCTTIIYHNLYRYSSFVLYFMYKLPG